MAMRPFKGCDQMVDQHQFKTQTSKTAGVLAFLVMSREFKAALAGCVAKQVSIRSCAVMGHVLQLMPVSRPFS